MEWFLKKINVTRANAKTPQAREKCGSAAGIFGICCNAVLFLMKIIMGMITGSVAVTADAFNNLSDSGSSLVTLLGFKIAAKPADADHPFGHGRSEYISSLMIALIILFVGATFLRSSVERIFSPAHVEFTVLAAVILVISMFVKAAMAYVFGKLAKITDSDTLKASRSDSINDIAVTLVTLLSLITSIWTDFPIDGYAGCAVSLFILWGGFSVARETLSTLLGKPAPKELVDAITNEVMSQPGILGMHDLIIHNYGPGRTMASLHAEVAAEGDILKAHDTIDVIEQRVLLKMHIPLVIHLDPVENENETVCRLREYVSDTVHEISPELSIHDFRMVSGDTHSNLIFDVVVPYSIKITNTQIKKKIDDKLRKDFDKQYYTVITFDKSYL